MNNSSKLKERKRRFRKNNG